MPIQLRRDPSIYLTGARSLRVHDHHTISAATDKTLRTSKFSYQAPRQLYPPACSLRVDVTVSGYFREEKPVDHHCSRSSNRWGRAVTERMAEE